MIKNGLKEIQKTSNYNIKLHDCVNKIYDIIIFMNKSLINEYNEFNE